MKAAKIAAWVIGLPVVLFFGSAILWGFGTAISDGLKSPQEKAFEGAKTLVMLELRDPASAVFTGLRYRAPAKYGETVCGYVNARNGFGGYVGAVRFVAWPKSLTVIMDDPDPVLGSNSVFIETWTTSECGA